MERKQFNLWRKVLEDCQKGIVRKLCAKFFLISLTGSILNDIIYEQLEQSEKGQKSNFSMITSLLQEKKTFISLCI